MKARYRAIIVDDEPLAREYLRSLLAEIEDFEVAAEVGDGPSAVTVIEQTPADVVFLDVQTPGMSGIDVLDHLAVEVLPLIVFVTAFDQYAIEAFDRHAVDYLLKPFDEKRFTVMLERLRERLGTKESKPGDSSELGTLVKELKKQVRDSKTFLSRIPVRVKERVVLVRTETIDWIEAADYYATIHTGGKGFLLRESLSSLESQLDPTRFVRIHRNAIVNIDSIAELRSIGGGEFQIVVGDGTVLRLSRRRKAAFEAVLGRSL
jgi:two-component system LytT family response regulator